MDLVSLLQIESCENWNRNIKRLDLVSTLQDESYEKGVPK